ncbi:MAG: hypothetical protein WC042_00020 [Candidatus Paceibacterota bacterium]|jgi:hypothetical protein|nr:hypothetical protein [Candidatus Paceibacterota bacterium]MDD3548589.1 hypothetical protein [Candidatus Paceibacterota bacterium]MDD4999028.1 hypothetical protein [Candidatus Paceibacterota bacterium]MDD5545195.1 hypothetical protein [Candidatus Paceibacterota bacterium]
MPFNFFDFSSFFNLSLKSLSSFIKAIIINFWWLAIPVILGKVFIDLKNQFKKSQKGKKEEIKDWVNLEIRLAGEISQTYKSIEQVFNGLHAIKKGLISLEIVGVNKEMHFVIRAPREYKSLLESQFYAQYSGIEIIETEDYFSRLPPRLPNKIFDLWGTEMDLEKDDYYPIKSYSFFAEQKEEQTRDPFSVLAEVINKLKKTEWFILSILLKPLDKDEEKKWIEEGKNEINKKMGKKVEQKKVGWQDWLPAFFENLMVGFARPPVWPGEGGENKESGAAINLSSGEREEIKAIEKKINQPSFKTGIRLLYISPKTDYDENNALNFTSFFEQFSAKDLNSFKINEEASTDKIEAKYFKKKKLLFKKLDFYHSVLKRKKTKKEFILSSEELATLYHFPSSMFKGPTLVRSLSKKGEPPTNLPIE